jgi:uncharacterized C2H2 Zn-finger protein
MEAVGFNGSSRFSRTSIKKSSGTGEGFLAAPQAEKLYCDMPALVSHIERCHPALAPACMAYVAGLFLQVRRCGGVIQAAQQWVRHVFAFQMLIGKAVLPGASSLN